MPRRTPDRRRIYDDIRRKIIDGTYPPGLKLPSLREMTAYYEVSEEPVRTAISWLSRDGWVETQQGKGSFVVKHPPIPKSDSEPATDR
jgi:DNA-binding GntR family transcriptional regulator